MKTNKPTMMDVVDHNDQVIGSISEMDATFNQERITRAAGVLLLNAQGEIYLQRRSVHKHRYPLHWDGSAGGLVSKGEPYELCAARELREELGVRRTPEQLFLLFKTFVQTDKKEFASIYMTIHDGPLRLNRAEIASGAFFSIKEIREMIRRGEPFSPFFLQVFSKAFPENY